MTDLTHLDLDPTVQAELEALEAALNGEPGADADLLALVEDVRATAEPLSLPLKSRLEDGVAAGFPKPARTKREWRLPTWALPAMGTATLLIVVGGIALSQGGSSNDAATSQLLSDGENSTLSAPTQTEAADSAAATAGGYAEPQSEADMAAPKAKTVAPLAPPSGAAGAGTVAPAPVQQDRDAVGRERKVERAVSMTLRVGRKQLESAGDDVIRATQSLGGYVSSSQVSGRDSGGEATFTLRIPSDKLDQAIKQFGTFGHISRMDQSSRDITSSFVSAEDRLGDARDERAALLKALGKAKTKDQLAALKSRLAANRSEISRFKGDLDALRRRANLSTVDLTIVATGRQDVTPGGGKKDDGTWSPGDAAGDALDILKVSVGVALVGLAVLLPLSILGLLAWFGARGVTRRRRESALDAV